MMLKRTLTLTAIALSTASMAFAKCELITSPADLDHHEIIDMGYAAFPVTNAGKSHELRLKEAKRQLQEHMEHACSKGADGAVNVRLAYEVSEKSINQTAFIFTWDYFRYKK